VGIYYGECACMQGRGLYSSLLKEKSPLKKIPLLADLKKKARPFFTR